MSACRTAVHTEKDEDGVIFYYESKEGPLVRVEFPVGHPKHVLVDYYEGARGEERLVRTEVTDGQFQGIVGYYEGARDDERLVRTEFPDGHPQHGLVKYYGAAMLYQVLRRGQERCVRRVPPPSHSQLKGKERGARSELHRSPTSPQGRRKRKPDSDASYEPSEKLSEVGGRRPSKRRSALRKENDELRAALAEADIKRVQVPIVVRVEASTVRHAVAAPTRELLSSRARSQTRDRTLHARALCIASLFLTGSRLPAARFCVCVRVVRASPRLCRACRRSSSCFRGPVAARWEIGRLWLDDARAAAEACQGARGPRGGEQQTVRG